MTEALYVTGGVLVLFAASWVLARVTAPACPKCGSGKTERVFGVKHVCRRCGHGWHDIPKGF